MAIGSAAILWLVIFMLKKIKVPSQPALQPAANIFSRLRQPLRFLFCFTSTYSVISRTF